MAKSKLRTPNSMQTDAGIQKIVCELVGLFGIFHVEKWLYLSPEYRYLFKIRWYLHFFIYLAKRVALHLTLDVSFK